MHMFLERTIPRNLYCDKMVPQKYISVLHHILTILGLLPVDICGALLIPLPLSGFHRAPRPVWVCLRVDAAYSKLCVVPCLSGSLNSGL